MPSIRTKDGAEIFYKDWGTGPVVMFSHGWPLSADAWEDQLFTLASHGYRAIAHDRRGHGRSSQTWNGNDMDTYADDLAAVVQTLDLTDVTHIGHSTGGGEVARYIGRHGTSRVKAAVLVSAIPPTMLKTERNPGGLPIEVFDEIRAGVATDRSQYYQDLAELFYSANRPNAKVSQGIKDAFWHMSMQAGLKASYDCIKQFSESVFYDDLAKFDVPTLIIHGDDDQIVPIDDAGRLTVQLVPGSTLKVYEKAPHGLMVTHRDRFNADLLEFLAR
jgi:non-heme chloroperoxidase